ncbi:MAG: transporter [Pseudomonadota bacterium]|nr:transporter [Pseudomonadota bacterium]
MPGPPAQCLGLLAGAVFGVAFVLPATAADDPASIRDAPSATPYRPSVSTPAALSAPGWLEVEGGVLHEHDAGGERRDSLPLTLKLAFSPDWGLRLGSDGWVRSTDGSQRSRGYGDSAVVVKRRFAVDEQQAFGVEAALTVPSGRRGLGTGSGKADYGVNAIYSADWGAWHGDLNLLTTRLGNVEAGASRLSVLAAFALSHPLGEDLGVVAELSGSYRHQAENSRQLLVAFSYNVSKRLVFDAGGARSLRGGAPTWSALAGFTWTAARLF